MPGLNTVFCPKGLVLCNSHYDGYSLVAAGNLRRQTSSTYFSRPPVSSLYLTYWHGDITHHSNCYKALGGIIDGGLLLPVYAIVLGRNGLASLAWLG